MKHNNIKKIREKWNIASKKYYQKNRRTINLKRKSYFKQWQRQHSLGVRGKQLTGITKRTYPKNNQCELCGEIRKYLAYHHWDDNDLKKGSFVRGIWVCLQCHHLITFVEKNNNWSDLIKKYFNLKKTINAQVLSLS